MVLHQGSSGARRQGAGAHEAVEVGHSWEDVAVGAKGARGGVEVVDAKGVARQEARNKAAREVRRKDIRHLLPDSP